MIIVLAIIWHKKSFKISPLLNIMNRLMTSSSKITTVRGGLKPLFPINSYKFIIYPIYTLIYIYSSTLTVYHPIIPLPLLFSFFRKKSNNKSKLVKRKITFLVDRIHPPRSPSHPPINKIVITLSDICPSLSTFRSLSTKHGQCSPLLAGCSPM